MEDKESTLYSAEATMRLLRAMDHLARPNSGEPATPKEVELMEKALKEGADPNAIGHEGAGLGDTPLMSAARVGDATLTRLLLAHGASAMARRASGWDALMIAAYGGMVDVVSQLAELSDMEARSSSGRGALALAACSGASECCDLVVAVMARKVSPQMLVEQLEVAMSGVAEFKQQEAMETLGPWLDMARQRRALESSTLEPGLKKAGARL
jgi:hypothetical protein